MFLVIVLTTTNTLQGGTTKLSDHMGGFEDSDFVHEPATARPVTQQVLLAAAHLVL